MAYSSVTKPEDHFNTVLYTGNGGSQSITGVGFQPDWLAIKRRNAASGTQNMDSVRGAANKLAWNEISAEEAPGNILSSFDTDGFSVGNSAAVNGSSDTFVAWNWLAGTSFSNDASSTGIGSLDSSGSVNETAGFSIVSYTGNETASTIKHGLSTTPSMIIVKGRIADRNWIVGHQSQGWSKSASMDGTGAFSSQTHWNNTAPTSSVFSIEGGSNSNVNTNGAGYIAYCFSERQGYSKMGSYTGNGNVDGPFVYTGFRPAWVMTKESSGTGHWRIRDNKRFDQINPIDKVLYANANTSETDEDNTDFLSNGFKLRTTGGENNGSGDTYIYMAFAEAPFVTAGTKAAGTAA